MRIKTYSAASVQEALTLAKQDMGPDAVILQTRELKEKSLFGMANRTTFEVTVGVDDKGRPEKSTAAVQKAAVDAIATHQLQSLQEEVRRMKHMMSQPKPAQTDGRLDAETLRRLFAGRVAPSTDGRAVIALIGPTGVGKTTTLAKLAARYALEGRRSVGLITLDTFRIGAVEQLRTYARILSVPLEVAHTPEDLAGAMRRLADRDVILIDTVGRSQKNRLQLNELQMFLDAARPTEVHLVVSASSSVEVQKDVVQNFGLLAPNRLIFTKIDEAVGLRCIADIALATRIPLSYVTCGQNVPDDIEPANPDRLAALVAEAA